MGSLLVIWACAGSVFRSGQRPSGSVLVQALYWCLKAWPGRKNWSAEGGTGHLLFFNLLNLFRERNDSPPQA